MEIGRTTPLSHPHPLQLGGGAVRQGSDSTEKTKLGENVFEHDQTIYTFSACGYHITLYSGSDSIFSAKKLNCRITIFIKEASENHNICICSQNDVLPVNKLYEIV